jgi:hypothetical protein
MAVKTVSCFTLPIEDDKYLDLLQLSSYCSLSVRTLRGYTSDLSDPLPSYMIRKKILVRKSEFDAWIKKYRVSQNNLADIVDEVLVDVL